MWALIWLVSNRRRCFLTYYRSRLTYIKSLFTCNRSLLTSQRATQSANGHAHTHVTNVSFCSLFKSVLSLTFLTVMADMRKVLSEAPRVEEFRFVIPYIEAGFWEVHVTLRDNRRRPIASDHILFQIR